jgi:integrase
VWVSYSGRVLSPDENDRLMDHLLLHLKPVIANAYYTLMWRGEIVNLKWDRLDLVNRMIRLKVEDNKDRELRSIAMITPLFISPPSI